MIAHIAIQTRALGAPSDLREGGGQIFVVRLFFLVALGLHDLFWPMLGLFLVVALLRDFFSYYFTLYDFFC